MLDERPQCVRQAGDEALDGVDAMDALAVLQRQPQPPVVDEPRDVQEVAASGTRALRGAAGLLGEPERRSVGERLVELTEVVEAHLGARKRVAQWRVPAAMLASLAILALIGYDNGSPDSLGSPMFHFFTGSTMVVALFIATDPVTHPTTHRGQLLFGCLVGCLTFAIRVFGNYPDGAAFAILLANSATPYLDKRLVPVRG